MDFGPLLFAHLKAKGLTAAEFARKLGLRAPQLFAIRAARSTAPLKHVGKWADTLGLSKQDRAEFEEAAMLTHCPQPLREKYRRLQDEVARLRADKR